LAFDAGATLLVSGGFDRTIRVWDLHPARCRSTTKGHREQVTTIAVAADGRRVVSGGDDGMIVRWDLAEGEGAVLAQGVGAVVRVVFAADAALLAAACGDRRVRIWDTQSWRLHPPG
jgi:WD40 repeat protein